MRSPSLRLRILLTLLPPFALLALLGSNYAICGPDGPESPPAFVVCAPPSVAADAAALSPVSLRAGCPADDAPLELLLWESTTGGLSVSVQPNVWVGRADLPGADRCVSYDIQLPFPDGSRRWIPAVNAGVDRVALSDGYCAAVGSIPIPSSPSLGPTTVRVRVVGATFVGEAELPAVIRSTF